MTLPLSLAKFWASSSYLRAVRVAHRRGNILGIEVCSLCCIYKPKKDFMMSGWKKKIYLFFYVWLPFPLGYFCILVGMQKMIGVQTLLGELQTNLCCPAHFSFLPALIHLS